MGCDEFEVLIEMRRRGALSGADADRLARHLEGCASCRAYDTLATRTEATMSGTAAETMRGIDWSALQERIERLRRKYTFAIARSLVGLAVVLPLIVLFTMPPEVQPFGWVLGAALGLFIVGKTTLTRRRWVRDSLAAGRTREDLLAFWRSDLDRRIRVLRLWPINLLGAIFLLLPWIAGRHGFPIGALVVTAAVAALLAAQGLWYALYLLPRLSRERRSLGG